MEEKINQNKQLGILATISYWYFMATILLSQVNSYSNYIKAGVHFNAYNIIGDIFTFLLSLVPFILMTSFFLKEKKGKLVGACVFNIFLDILLTITFFVTMHKYASIPQMADYPITHLYADSYYGVLSLLTVIILLILISKKQIEKGFFVGALSVSVIQAVIRLAFSAYICVTEITDKSKSMTIVNKLLGVNHDIILQIANIVFIVATFLFIIGGKEGLAQLKDQGFVKNRFIKEKVVATIPYNQTPMYNQYAQQPRPVQPQYAQQPRPVQPQNVQQPRPVQPQYAQQPRPVQPQYAQQPRPVQPQYAQQPRPVQPQYAQQPRPVQPQYAQQPRPVQPQYAQQPRPVQPQYNQPMQQPVQNNVNVEQELEKYKNMLDKGLIDQDDYDKKKAELLK